MHETVEVLGRAREYFSEDDNYSPLFPDEVISNQSGVKIGRGMLSPPEVSLNLYILAAKVSNFTNQEDMCYEFFVQVILFNAGIDCL